MPALPPMDRVEIMTVAELIAALQKMPGDAEIFLRDDDHDSCEFYREPGELSTVVAGSVMHPHYPNATTTVVVIE